MHQNVTPLMPAAGRNRDNVANGIVRLLLAHGADPCVRDDHNRTLADNAAKARNAREAELLAPATSLKGRKQPLK